MQSAYLEIPPGIRISICTNVPMRKYSLIPILFEAKTFWPVINVTLFGGQYDYEFIVSEPNLHHQI